MLAFEPPAFGEAATIGGTIAAGLSGPARPYAGAARDFVLGTRVLNGKGEALRFGGEVMKNVAGYDVSRLMTGACGTLGVLLEVSLKVLPRPAVLRTLAFDASAAEAIDRCNAWAAKPLPITGACHDGERLLVRLAGTEGGVAAAAGALGGETIDGDAFWTALREQTLPFSPAPGRRCGASRFLPAPRRRTPAATPSSTGAVRCAGCAPTHRRQRSGPSLLTPAATRRSFAAETAPVRCSIHSLQRCASSTSGSRPRSIRPVSSTPKGCTRESECEFIPPAAAERTRSAPTAREMARDSSPFSPTSCRTAPRDPTGRTRNSECRPVSPTSSATPPTGAPRTPSCASACTAASAPPRVRPTCSSATSSMGPAGASTS